MTDDSPRSPRPDVAPAFADSALVTAARRAGDHLIAHDTPKDADGGADRIELWGRRIGRALSLAACIVLGIYLYLTYIR